jgi:hypothetical protein
MVNRIESVTTEDVRAVAETMLKGDDKLYLLSMRDDATAFRLCARELDCHTRTWQPLATRTVIQPGLLADAAFDVLLDAFAPLVRVEDARSEEAEVRTRARGLITRPQCPAKIGAGAVLLPVIRRNDRLGEPMINGILVAPWTFLTVVGRRDNVLECTVHSGMRSPLRGRASTRTEKLALRIKPRRASTELVLRTRGENPQPLDGYAIYAKNLETGKSEPVGSTDWRGALRIPRSDPALMIYYVRNGNRLLARLPMVAGFEARRIAELYNDDVRLQAEGFVKGLQNRVMDLVARRELYILRFHRHLERKEYDQAQALLEEFRSLDTRSDLTNLINQQEQRFTSGQRGVQAKIDRLLSDTRQLVRRFLDPDTSNQLQQELLQAQRAG